MEKKEKEIRKQGKRGTSTQDQKSAVPKQKYDPSPEIRLW